MEYITVGSEALKFFGVPWREPKDHDVFATYKIPGKCDTIIIPQHILDMMCEYNSMAKYGYATPEAIYTIKCSHLGWDIFWKKHKSDVLKLQKLGYGKIIRPLYDALVEHWKNVNGNKEKLNMYQTRSDFFNNAVPYVYDHEWLHKIVSLPNEPIYLSVHEDGQEVAISEEKFLKLSFNNQLRMIKEEIAVIAIERWLVNPECIGKYHWIKAWEMSVHKVMTALTKDWTTDFMVKNLRSFIRPDFNYFKNFYDKGLINMAVQVNNYQAIVDEIWAAYAAQAGLDVEDVGDVDGGLYEFTHELESFGEFESIETRGGEDEGSYAHFIFRWKDTYYKLVYSYYSGDGYQFDYPELYIVVPTPVTETKYV